MGVGLQPRRTTDSAMFDALRLAEGATLGVWDAVILAATNECGCTLLISEDMQHGFRWKGVTIVNPFMQPPHPMLVALLK
jgi:predicted nucleic acid-binding protein